MSSLDAYEKDRTDLVKRLRDPNFPPKPAGHMALRLRAADEIERLRELVKQSDYMEGYEEGFAAGKIFESKQVLDNMREWSKDRAIDATFETQTMDLRFRQWLDAYEFDAYEKEI